MIKDICGDIAMSFVENSPKLMIIGGVAMMLVGGVWACVKTKDDLVQADVESEQDIRVIKQAREECSEEDYTKKDYQRDLAWAYGRKVIRYTKVYAGPVIVSVIGIALIFGGEYMIWARLASTIYLSDSQEQQFQMQVMG